jgi:DMSO/TMAO reductase YedYZ molybdopterin-dependent catalytic subunit
LLPFLFAAAALACSSKAGPRAAPQGALEVRTPSGSRTLHRAELEKLPRRTVDGGGGRYGGARMTDVVGAVPAAASIVVRGHDGYTQTLSHAAATREDCLVAWEKDGQPLAAPEGPIRIVLPGSPGLSVHQVASLELVTTP